MENRRSWFRLHAFRNPAQPEPKGARTSVRIPSRTAQVNEAIWHRACRQAGDQLALKRNKFRAPKIVAAREDFARW